MNLLWQYNIQASGGRGHLMQVNETQESRLKARQSLSICRKKVMLALLSPLAEVAC